MAATLESKRVTPLSSLPNKGMELGLHFYPCGHGRWCAKGSLAGDIYEFVVMSPPWVISEKGETHQVIVVDDLMKRVTKSHPTMWEVLLVQKQAA
jgi:hypothetical protein